MLVKCIINTVGTALTRGMQSYAIEESFHFDNDFEFLALGKIYSVYGILTTERGIWIFVLQDEDDEYPKQYPISFFEILDSSISPDWVIGNGQEFSSASRKVFSLLTFGEWATNNFYYENLVNGESLIVDNFRKKVK